MGLFSRAPAAPATYRKIRTLTAAAQQVEVTNTAEIEKFRKRRQSAKWQDDAWGYYDAIGEVKFAFNFLGAVMSRVHLYAGVMPERGDAVPVRASEAADVDPSLAQAARSIMATLGAGHGGTPGVLQAASINLSVAGECYLVQTPAKLGTGAPESWRVRSVDELVVPIRPGDPLAIKPSGSASLAEYELLPPGAVAGRIWRMHPRYSDQADSSLLGILDLMDELLLLSRSARATAKSRLNAGLLFIPDGLSAAYQADGETPASEVDPDIIAPESDSESDEFEEQLMDSMTTPITDEGSASAVVPLIVRGPSELGEKIKLIKFERSFDPQLQQRGERVLERILMGLDLPKELVTGLASAKYANAVHIEETLYKAHIEPMCLILCDAFTEIFLRPLLRARGFTADQVSKLVVWYDPSEITTKPDKASAATQGYQMKALSAAAWRHANGFTDPDGPENDELLQRIVMERGLVGEPLSEAIFRQLAPELMQTIRTQQIENSPSPLPTDVQNLIESGGIAPPDQGAPPPDLAEPA